MDIARIRKDFPFLSQRTSNGKYPLAYFDNGATTQKPSCVLKIIVEYYELKNSNIHRGIHSLSQQATRDYEAARELVRDFINANEAAEIIFTQGTTMSINLLAFSFGEKYITEGDEIIITEMEHHANIVPWQLLCERKGAKLKFIPVNDNGELQLDTFKKLFSSKTKLVSLVHISNVLGTINPVKEIIELAHLHGVPVALDAAQSIQHTNIDVQQLDVDFLSFSGHKLYGPTGIGVLFGKRKYLDEMPPYMGGGDMVDTVTLKETTFAALPFKFEAGTTNYIGAIGMAEGIKYIREIGLDKISARESELLNYATKKLMEIPGMKIFGTSAKKAAIISFNIDGIHPLDAGMILDKMGIAVRTGTHCAQPLMEHFGIDGTIRAGISFYNTTEEIDQLVSGLEKVCQMLG